MERLDWLRAMSAGALAFWRCLVQTAQERKRRTPQMAPNFIPRYRNPIQSKPENSRSQKIET